MPLVPSVSGSLDTALLGPTLMHEHVIARSPGVIENFPTVWDRNAEIEHATETLRSAKDGGVQTIVDLTTADLGRDVRFVREVAERSGMQVIVATGIWWDVPRYFHNRPVEVAADLFIRDIMTGIQDTGIKAGIIKCATDVAGVTRPIETILRASARAHRATGVPISTHTYAAGQMGLKQQEIFAEEGVDLSRVIIGHSGDSEDLDYLKQLMERGSTIGMDRFGIDRILDTERRCKVIAELCRQGYAGRMVLSHDTNCYFDSIPEEIRRERMPNWHYLHIHQVVLPRLRELGVSEEQIDQMLFRNPRALFEQQGAY
ncbi:MAG: phosphotriesterase family protein [Dehalococcoidia bacterium]